jgi:hypothetical protein
MSSDTGPLYLGFDLSTQQLKGRIVSITPLRNANAHLS